MLELPDLELLLKGDPEMMTLPSMVYELLDLIDSSHSSTEEIAELVSQDAVLAAKVLRMVNSAYYGMVAQIETVQHAISMIGLKTLRDIVVVAKVGEKFSGIPPEVANVESFWVNNLFCAGMAKRLDQIQLTPRHNVFAPALLSNIGALVFLQKLPKVSKRILLMAEESNQDVYKVEQTILGYTHADIGAELMENWNLPKIFIEVAHNRNQFHKAARYINEAAIVHLAASFADKHQPFINFAALGSFTDQSAYNYVYVPENLINELITEIGTSSPDLVM